MPNIPKVILFDIKFIIDKYLNNSDSRNDVTRHLKKCIFSKKKKPFTKHDLKYLK